MFEIIVLKLDIKNKLSLPAAFNKARNPLHKQSHQEGFGLARDSVLDYHLTHPLEQGTKAVHSLSHTFLDNKMHLHFKRYLRKSMI